MYVLIFWQIGLSVNVAKTVQDRDKFAMEY